MSTPDNGNAVERIVVPREISFGDFGVRRSMPARELYSVGPWVFFDHFGPVTFERGKGVDVIPHPHINLSTVTYLFEGEIVHRDTIGSVQTIRPGAVNLMYAGRGIAHSERTTPELRTGRHTVHGLQLWTGLPADHEEMDPGFLHYASSDLPTMNAGAAFVRVMIGDAFGLHSPVTTVSPALYAEALIPAHHRLELDGEAGERAVYTVSGIVRAGDTEIPEHRLALIRSGRPIMIDADAESRIAIIGGEPLGRRYMWWNFVSSRRERIEEAKGDWKQGRFGSIPGEREYHKLPERDSFFD